MRVLHYPKSLPLGPLQLNRFVPSTADLHAQSNWYLMFLEQLSIVTITDLRTPTPLSLKMVSYLNT